MISASIEKEKHHYCQMLHNETPKESMHYTLEPGWVLNGGLDQICPTLIVELVVLGKVSFWNFSWNLINHPKF